MNNPLTAMLRRVRQLRRERRAEASSNIALEDLLSGYRTTNRYVRYEPDDFADDRDWSPEDEKDLFFD